LATEAQRQLFENFSMFIRSFLPKYPQPDADSIESLPMAVIVDQNRLGGGAHSTVGTVTDSYTVLRLLFSRCGKPHLGGASRFSFNDPQGMCPNCEGRGEKQGFKLDALIAMDRSLNEGAIQIPFWGKAENAAFARSRFFDNDKKLRDFSPVEMDLLLYGADRKEELKKDHELYGAHGFYEGLVEKLERRYIKRDLSALSERSVKQIEPYMVQQTCSVCRGTRLSQAALACRLAGRNIAEMAAMGVDELLELISGLDEPAAGPIIDSLVERLQAMVDIGLDYLSLDRETDSLSGGESQRVKMVKHLASSLVDVMYVFDEPSVGLHPQDVHRLNELLAKLRDKGNTVVVVEHDPDVIRAADHVVDMGPGAGGSGGRIVYQGPVAGLYQSQTLTGQHLDRKRPLKSTFRKATGSFPIRNACVHNLKNVNVDLPKGVLTVITGVAGSGKSSLLHGAFLPAHPGAIVIDQSAVSANSRSTPATYTGIMDDVRRAFATACKVDAGLFSFNSKGACEACKGLGVVYTDLAFLEGVRLPCEACEGRRFKEDVLAYRLNGKTISEVLAMTVGEAIEHFKQREIVRMLQAMYDVGLEYLTLGQPVATLSGGECQRIKLASELGKERAVAQPKAPAQSEPGGKERAVAQPKAPAQSEPGGKERAVAQPKAPAQSEP
ncbi:MAG: ATP-binding cassette domain-containing protein, partial [Cyanobacteria bacterium REEB65]|nr:ATP-binding cassette domain-containing protein [Cyanobacteria bacterium REEB65]